MDNDMRCIRCGVSPETVIWDGITLAFGRKHLSSSLSPPTQTSPSSIQHLNIKNHPRQQLILDSALRKLIRQVVNAPRLELEEEEAKDEEAVAEESVLQMINGVALTDLCNFLGNPQPQHLTKILSIPGLYQVPKNQSTIHSFIPLLFWLANRAYVVLQQLSVETAPLSQRPEMVVAQSDWKVLKSDYKKDVSKPRGDRCGKYYTQYGERRLTGGIMVAWCTHSVCYGFHCIPESEGRNDVFSAMMTRWPVAPKRVIYDFACALGPYCMLQEPTFFKNTFFTIDHFTVLGTRNAVLLPFFPNMPMLIHV
ncbi:hypothetical protein H1R20_g11539, partial [Candolleomyces eurysporus]